MPNPYEALILLGGNQENVLSTFEAAEKEMEKQGVKAIKKSSVYKTEPWGKADQPWFLNKVVLAKTTLQPLDLLKLFQKLEEMAGRTRSEKWGPRVLDLDLLLFDSWILETDEIIVPHPRMHNRNFTLIPACEIAGEWIHPKKGKSLKTLLLNSTDKLEVIRVGT